MRLRCYNVYAPEIYVCPGSVNRGAEKHEKSPFSPKNGIRQDMNFSEITYYLSSLKVSEVVCAIIALALSVGVKFLIKNKYKRFNSLLPVISGVAVSLVSSMIFERENTFKEIMDEGMRTGSAATVLYVIICGFFKDDYVALPFENLVAESLLSGFVSEEELEGVAGRCVEILCECLNGEKKNAKDAPLKSDCKKTVKRGRLSEEEYLNACNKAETSLTDYLEGVIRPGGRSAAELLSKTIVNIFKATR